MEYKYKWYIPDAYLHSRGTGYFTSHEGCAFIPAPCLPAGPSMPGST